MIRTPRCILTADSKPLNALITSRIISVTVTDNRSGEADQLDIILDDHDGQLMLPRRGVKINCMLGFAGETLHDKGDFIVDGIEFSGAPDIITVKASSANFKSSIKSGNSKSYHRQTLGQVAGSIAKTHSLKLVITDELSGIDLNHVDQTNESDLNFLTRLARQNGAEMAIKKDRLLIFKAGSAKTASGKQLPTITVTRQDGDQFRYAEEDRDSDYTGVAASYQDKGKAKRTRVTSGKPEIRGGGDDLNTKTRVLKGTFADEASAKRAADAEMAKVKRQMATFSITTAFGIPSISTESPTKLQGFKKQVNQLKWIVAKATHSYSTSGLTTQLELEAGI